jgi:hypothetical protein
MIPGRGLDQAADVTTFFCELGGSCRASHFARFTSNLRILARLIADFRRRRSPGFKYPNSGDVRLNEPVSPLSARALRNSRSAPRCRLARRRRRREPGDGTP